MSSFPPPITALKLRVYTGASPPFEQTITSAVPGNNSVQITDSGLLSAFNNQPPGTIFNASIVTTFQGFPSGETIISENASSFMPKQVTTILSLADLPALTILSSSVSLVPLITTNSPAPVSYSSSDESVISVSSGGLLTVQGLGSATITITQPATSDNVYTAATPVVKVVNIVKVETILSNFGAITKNANDAPFTLTAPTSNSDGLISYESSNTSVATISDSTVTIVGVGYSTITARQEATANYTSATIVSTLTVNSINQILDIKRNGPTIRFFYTLTPDRQKNDVSLNYNTFSNSGWKDFPTVFETNTPNSYYFDFTPSFQVVNGFITMVLYNASQSVILATVSNLSISGTFE